MLARPVRRRQRPVEGLHLARGGAEGRRERNAIAFLLGRPRPFSPRRPSFLLRAAAGKRRLSPPAALTPVEAPRNLAGQTRDPAMILAAASLLLSAAQAPDAPSTAAPWRHLGEARGYRILYDPAPVARAGEVLTARVLTRFAGARPDDPAYVVATVEIRCAAGEARVTRTTNHRADGAVVRDDTTPLPFGAIRSDSLFASLRQALC